MEKKKLSTGVKWGIGIASGVVLLVTGIVIFKPKKDTTPGGSGNGDASGGASTGGSFIDNLLGKKDEIKDLGTSVIAGTAAAGTSWKILEIHEKITGATDTVITFDLPRPKQGEIKSYNKILIAGTGKFDGEARVYISNGTWTDGAGNIGAIYVKTGKVTEDKTWKPTSGTVTKV